MENPQIAKRIVEKGILAAKARVAAKRAREVTRKKSGLEISNLPGKLADCSSNNPAETELFTSKETQLVDQPNLVVTVNFRQFFQSAVRF